MGSIEITRLENRVPPRKYEIKPLERCTVCDRADDCEYLQSLMQAPYDASGVLMDCKAFYTVFCELEERCRVPFGDPAKMREYLEEDAGKRPFLTPAVVTNGALAAELALKALTLVETGTFDCVHELDKLFYSLPETHLRALSSLIKDKAHQNDATLRTNLETISGFFVEWRYFFESDSIGCSGFLLEFIHIVCDYAITEIEGV